MSGAAVLSGIVVVSALSAVALIVSIVLTTDGQSQFAALSYAPVTLDEQYQSHLCSCRNEWSLATDERTRSNDIFAQVQSYPDARNLSALVMFWGQFIDHDIVRSDQTAEHGIFTIQMVPSAAVLTMKRNIHRNNSFTGCRESQNFNTPIIDATTVYGDALNPLEQTLRDQNRCKLRTSAGNLLPVFPNNTFQAGDPRNTEHSVLASLHTLWMREHNRLCDMLATDYPDWTQTELFWKARQIVIAKIQHITYTQWLPTLFGPGQFHLLRDTTTPHSPPDARIVSEFSVVAYRFGHSGIPAMVGPFQLPQIFFNASMIIDLGIEPFLQGAFDGHAETVDHFVVDGLRNFMFSAGMGIFGEDLVTRNLFRAREVGIGTYATLKHCYLDDPAIVHNELEAYVGLLEEPVAPGSSLPPGIAKIVAEQFIRLRIFDPNFYTRISKQIGSKYYAEVQASTLGQVIADNTALKNVPADVFLVS